MAIVRVVFTSRRRRSLKKGSHKLALAFLASSDMTLKLTCCLLDELIL